MKPTPESPGDINDRIRAQVEEELPRPVGGFANDTQEDYWRSLRDARFMQLVRARSAPNPAAVALGRLGGKSKSPAKLKAIAKNARRGGWPKGRPRKLANIIARAQHSQAKSDFNESQNYQ